MQRESPSFFFVIRNRQIYFFSPKKWKTDPLKPVIKEVQFTGSFSRPLVDVARHRVSPGTHEHSPDTRPCVPAKNSSLAQLNARVRENFPEIKNRSFAHEKIYAKHRFHTSDICRLSHVWKIPNRFAPCAPKFAHGTRKRKNRFNFAHRH